MTRGHEYGVNRRIFLLIYDWKTFSSRDGRISILTTPDCERSVQVATIVGAPPRFPPGAGAIVVAASSKRKSPHSPGRIISSSNPLQP